MAYQIWINQNKRVFEGVLWSKSESFTKLRYRCTRFCLAYTLMSRSYMYNGEDEEVLGLETHTHSLHALIVSICDKFWCTYFLENEIYIYGSKKEKILIKLVNMGEIFFPPTNWHARSHKIPGALIKLNFCFCNLIARCFVHLCLPWEALTSLNGSLCQDPNP